MQFWIARCIFLSFRRFIHRTNFFNLIINNFQKNLKYKYKISRKNPGCTTNTSGGSFIVPQ